jgi:GDP-4-dehydro-6-deoxy-D-mannose reductase
LLRALITGVGGFAGSHLADELLSQPATEVWGCALAGPRPAYLAEPVTLAEIDLRDPQAVTALLEQVRPHRLYHLAGQAFPQQSWIDPWETFEGNLRPQINLFEALRQLGLPARVLVVSSNEVYGQGLAGSRLVTEAAELRPRNPYAVSKAAQDLLGLQYYLSHSLHVVRARPSNHIGPRQDARYVAAAFARQIALIEAGQQEPVMRVGDLSAQRDFTDVRDIVWAYRLVLEQGQPGEAYNIGTGRALPVQALLDGLLALTPARIRIEVDPALLRPAEALAQCGDPGKLRAATGWTPQITLAQTLADLLDYERARLAETLQATSR